jgi:hypothetical protein
MTSGGHASPSHTSSWIARKSSRLAGRASLLWSIASAIQAVTSLTSRVNRACTYVISSPDCGCVIFGGSRIYFVPVDCHSPVSIASRCAVVRFLKLSVGFGISGTVVGRPFVAPDDQPSGHQPVAQRVVLVVGAVRVDVLDLVRVVDQRRQVLDKLLQVLNT